MLPLPAKLVIKLVYMALSVLIFAESISQNILFVLYYKNSLYGMSMFINLCIEICLSRSTTSAWDVLFNSKTVIWVKNYLRNLASLWEQQEVILWFKKLNLNQMKYDPLYGTVVLRYDTESLSWSVFTSSIYVGVLSILCLEWGCNQGCIDSPVTWVKMLTLFCNLLLECVIT